MTISDARLRARRFFVLASALIIIGLTATLCRGAEADKFSLSLSLVEEYNDNLFEARSNHQADFISRVIPGVSWKHLAAHWDAALQYHLEYVHYARNKHRDELNHYFIGNTQIHLLNEFFFLDIADTYSRISLDDITGTATPNLFTRQTDQNFLTISPYLLWRTTPKLAIKTGYRYQNQYYSRDEAIDWQGHGAFIEADYTLTPKLSAIAGSEFMRTFPHQGTTYNRLTNYAGFNYEITSQSRVALRGGYSLLQFDGGETRQRPYWNGELVHVFGRNTATLSTGVLYQADFLRTSSEKRYVRGRLQRDHGRGIVGATAAYSQTRDAETGRGGYSTVEAGIDGTYEHTDKLSSHAGSSVIWYGDDRIRPCRLHAGTGLIYSMPADLSLAFDYQLISNREQLAGGDATYTNRFILTLSKVW